MCKSQGGLAGLMIQLCISTILRGGSSIPVGRTPTLQVGNEAILGRGGVCRGAPLDPPLILFYIYLNNGYRM